MHKAWIKSFLYTGKVLYQSIESLQNFQLDMRDLAAGVYVLKIDTDKGWFREKLVIE